MYDNPNSFLKSPEEIDFDLEANIRAINSDISRNRPKDYEIQTKEIDLSLTEENSDTISHRSNEPGRTFSIKGSKKIPRMIL